MTTTEIREALRLIAANVALDAETEYELEDLGLIRSDDGPYAKLTAKGARIAS